MKDKRRLMMGIEGVALNILNHLNVILVHYSNLGAKFSKLTVVLVCRFQVRYLGKFHFSMDFGSSEF